MLRHKFYEINTKAYLFKQEDGPEEKVRQWAIYELISYFQYSVNDIDIEIPVKVGRRTHFADIVVNQGGKPYIVVECKRCDDNKVDEGLKQAISYASSESISARFAVFTNGNKWVVRKRVKDAWLPVPDIPKKFPDGSIIEEFYKLISDLETLKPLLYWSYSSVPYPYSVRFLYFMQTFFANSYRILEYVNYDLLDGVELVLRPIISEQSYLDNDYAMKKLENAQIKFSSYFDSIDAEWEPVHYNIHDTDEYVNIFILNFENLVKNCRDLNSQEVSLIRLILWILRYFRSTREISNALEIPEGLVMEFQDVIVPFFEDRLGYRFPDRLDENGLEILKEICSEEWQIQ